MSEGPRRGQESSRAVVRLGVIASSVLVVAMTTLSACSRAPSAPLEVRTFIVRGPGGETFAVSTPERFGRRMTIREGESYELVATVAVPPPLRGGAARLSIPSFLANPVLYADGERIERQGLLLPSLFAVRQPHAYVLPARLLDDGVVTLRFVVPHRWPFDTSLETTPRIRPIGERDGTITALLVVNVLCPLFALGAGLVAAVNGVFVALTSRANRHYLLVTLAMLGLVPNVLLNQGLMQFAFGAGETFVAASGIALTVLATLWFIAAFFERPAPHRGFLVVGASIPLTWLLWPRIPESVFLASGLVGIVFVAGVSSQMKMLYALTRESVAGARPWLACWVVLAVSSLPDVVLSGGGPDLSGGFRTSMVGILVFCSFFAYLTAEGEALRLLDARVELDRRVEDLVRARDAAAVVTKSRRAGVIARSTRFYTALAGLANQRPIAAMRVGDRLDDDRTITRVLDADDRSYESVRGSTAERNEVVVFSDVRGPTLAGAARVLARLLEIDHPGVTRPIDVDVTREGFLYAVFPLEHGKGFGDATRAATPRNERIAILVGLAEALAAMHAAGVVHGRITGANVFVDVDRDGAATPRLGRIDLGTRRLVHEVDRARERERMQPDAVEAEGDATQADRTVVSVDRGRRDDTAVSLDTNASRTAVEPARSPRTSFGRVPRTRDENETPARADDDADARFSEVADVRALAAMARAWLVVDGPEGATPATTSELETWPSLRTLLDEAPPHAEAT